MYMYIMLTKKNKKMMGGSARAPNPYNVSMFNSHFVKLFNFYAKTHSNPDKPYDEPYVNISKSFTGEGIYIGFYDELHKITFGSVLDFAKTTTHTSFNHETLFYITITDKGNIIVNKFKLYIMSVIANYNMDGQKSLYDILKDDNNLDMNNIILKKNPTTANETKGFISKLDFMISGRLHGSVAALTSCIPTLMLKYMNGPECHKLNGFANFINYENYILEINASSICEKFNDIYNNKNNIIDHLKINIDNVKIEALNSFNLLE